MSVRMPAVGVALARHHAKAQVRRSIRRRCRRETPAKRRLLFRAVHLARVKIHRPRLQPGQFEMADEIILRRRLHELRNRRVAEILPGAVPQPHATRCAGACAFELVGGHGDFRFRLAALRLAGSTFWNHCAAGVALRRSGEAGPDDSRRVRHLARTRAHRLKRPGILRGPDGRSAGERAGNGGGGACDKSAACDSVCFEVHGVLFGLRTVNLASAGTALKDAISTNRDRIPRALNARALDADARNSSFPPVLIAISDLGVQQRLAGFRSGIRSPNHALLRVRKG